MSGTVAWAEPKKRMTKRHSGTEPATKTVAEVATWRAAAMVRFNRLNCSQGHSSGALVLPGRRGREIAGSVRPITRVMLRKSRRYGGLDKAAVMSRHYV